MAFIHGDRFSLSSVGLRMEIRGAGECLRLSSMTAAVHCTQMGRVCVSWRRGGRCLCKEVDEKYVWGGDPERWLTGAKDRCIMIYLTVHLPL